MKNKFHKFLGIALFILVSWIPQAVFGQSATFTYHWIDINGKTSNGEKALVIHYDLNVQGYYGHSVSVTLELKDEVGDFLLNKDKKKLKASTTHDVHYDNSTFDDRTMAIPYSKFNVPSGKNTYYYRLTCADKVTGSAIGRSDFTKFEMTGASSSGNSGKKNTTPKQSVTFSDLRSNKTTTDKGADAIKYFFDVTLTGCRGRTVNVNLNFTDANGNYLYDKEGKKLYWTKTYSNITSDNIKYTDQSFTIALNKLKNPYGQKYYFNYTAHDKTSGNLLGSSEKQSQYWGPEAACHNAIFMTEKSDDGKQLVYNLHYQLYYSLPEASDLIFAHAIYEDSDYLVYHRDKNGKELIQQTTWKNTDKQTLGYLNVVSGFEHDEINAPNGIRDFYLRIMVFDAKTKNLLAESGPWLFYASGDGSPVKQSDVDNMHNNNNNNNSSDYDKYDPDSYWRYLGGPNASSSPSNSSSSSSKSTSSSSTKQASSSSNDKTSSKTTVAPTTSSNQKQAAPANNNASKGKAVKVTIK